MELKATDLLGKEYRVFLDGRLVPYATAANDIEGWVEVVDTKFIGMVAPITAMPERFNWTTDQPPEPIEIKVKRLTGKVELRRIPLRK